MVTVGIDLAAEPRDTAGCAIEWTSGAATVRWVSTGLQDEEILRRASEADMVGIDAPFGWPSYFVEAISAHHAGRKWPVEAWEKPLRRRLRLRVTDDRVHQVTGKLTPLSVSSDAIAIPATRCAWLLDRLGVSDRSGGRVREVYPAAALFQWGLRYRGYKGPKSAALLEELFTALEARIPWLTVSADHERLCATSDDAFDALVASLIARAAYLGLTLQPRRKIGPRQPWKARSPCRCRARLSDCRCPPPEVAASFRTAAGTSSRLILTPVHLRFRGCPIVAIARATMR